MAANWAGPVGAGGAKGARGASRMHCVQGGLHQCTLCCTSWQAQTEHRLTRVLHARQVHQVQEESAEPEEAAYTMADHVPQPLDIIPGPGNLARSEPAACWAGAAGAGTAGGAGGSSLHRVQGGLRQRPPAPAVRLRVQQEGACRQLPCSCTSRRWPRQAGQPPTLHRLSLIRLAHLPCLAQ